MRYGITGANGFVGGRLVASLKTRGENVGQLSRRVGGGGVPEWRIDGPLDVIIHAAARVHVMKETSMDALAEFRRANVEGTLNLARQAVRAGVGRFVYVSSVKVNGEITTGQPFTAFDTPAPSDPYGISKLEAEQGLRALSVETGLEVVVVRPPLVYGAGVGANFQRLIRLVQLNIPLPLGTIENHRSMVALENLVDLLIVCGTHSNAPGGTFMVSDEHDVSTSELLRMVAKAMGKRARLLPVPTTVLRRGAALLGRSALAGRLLGSLQVDIAHTKLALDWKPVVGMQAALDETVAHYLARHN